MLNIYQLKNSKPSNSKILVVDYTMSITMYNKRKINYYKN